MRIMKRKRIICIGLILLSMGVSRSWSQMTGNPIDARGTNQWTLSALGTYMDQQLGGAQAISKRLLAKSTWGIAPWLDIYCLGGVAQVDLKKNSAALSDYSGKYRFSYGAGINMIYKPHSTSGLWFVVGAQALRFPSEGSFTENLLVGSEYYTREFEMSYDWREVKINGGIVIPSRSFRVYLAVVGWLVQRLETKREYLDNGTSRMYVGEEEGEYRTGMWSGGIIGLEILLPQRYSISIEGLFFNEQNYQLMIGICQTGLSRW
jgi:hypothetical protein